MTIIKHLNDAFLQLILPHGICEFLLSASNWIPAAVLNIHPHSGYTSLGGKPCQGSQRHTCPIRRGFLKWVGSAQRCGRGCCARPSLNKSCCSEAQTECRKFSFRSPEDRRKVAVRPAGGEGIPEAPALLMESLPGAHVTGSWQLEPNKNPGSDTLQYVALGEAVGGRMSYSVDFWDWTQFTCWVELKCVAGYMCAAMKLDHLILQDIPVNDNQKKVWKWWELRPCLVTLVVFWRRVVVMKTKRISLFVCFVPCALSRWQYPCSLISELLACYFPLSCARMLNLYAFLKMDHALWSSGETDGEYTSSDANKASVFTLFLGR